MYVFVHISGFIYIYTYLSCWFLQFVILTVSDPAAVTSSCRALTDRACSMTKTHWERSGGTFLSAIFSRKQCRLPNPSAARQTRSPVAVQESVTISSCKCRHHVVIIHRLVTSVNGNLKTPLDFNWSENLCRLLHNISRPFWRCQTMHAYHLNTNWQLVIQPASMVSRPKTMYILTHIHTHTHNWNMAEWENESMKGDSWLACPTFDPDPDSDWVRTRTQTQNRTNCQVRWDCGQNCCV